MPDIGTIGSTSGYGNVAPITRSGAEVVQRGHALSPQTPTADERRPEARDRVELSDHARFLDALRSMPDVRMEKVHEIRAALAAGTYETEGKIGIAVERLLQELDG